MTETRPTAMAGAVPADAAGAGPIRISAELHRLQERFDDRPVRLAVLLATTQEWGVHLLLVFIALPFVTPVPLPGFSIPFGIVIALLGTGLVLDRAPWLPSIVLQRELPPRALGRMLRGAMRTVRFLESLMRPRFTFMREHRAFRQFGGLLIVVCGLLLVLPFPIPFTNSLPAWTVLLLSAGELGHDGAFFLAGCATFALTVAFFTLLAVGGAEAVELLRGVWSRG